MMQNIRSHQIKDRLSGVPPLFPDFHHSSHFFFRLSSVFCIPSKTLPSFFSLCLWDEE